MVNATQLNPFILPSIVGCIILIPELALLITRHSRTHSATAADRLSLVFLWSIILSSIVVAIPFAFFQIPQLLHFELDVSGIVLMFVTLCSGLILRCWSIRTLGEFFTVNVAFHQKHRLVSRGPYAWIRHPSYTGLILEFFALALTYQNVISLCIIMLPTLYALLQRITIEERVLEEALGEEYRSYQHQTAVLFPFLY